MDSLNKLVAFLGDLAGHAKGAVVALALLALVGLLWTPVVGIGQSLVASGSSLMSASGNQLLVVLAALWLCADKK